MVALVAPEHRCITGVARLTLHCSVVISPGQQPAKLLHWQAHCTGKGQLVGRPQGRREVQNRPCGLQPAIIGNTAALV
jgi:hypothetical protein